MGLNIWVSMALLYADDLCFSAELRTFECNSMVILLIRAIAGPEGFWYGMTIMVGQFFEM